MWENINLVTVKLTEYDFLREQNRKYQLLMKEVDQDLSNKNVIYVERDSDKSINKITVQTGFEPNWELVDIASHIYKLERNLECLQREHDNALERQIKVEEMLDESRTFNKTLLNVIERYKSFVHEVRDKLYRLDFITRLDFLLFPEQRVQELYDKNSLWRYDANF